MRQLVLQSFPDASGISSLKDREYRYLAQVLRLAPGDVVEARLPDGNLCPMLVAAVDRRARTISLQRVEGAARATRDGRPSTRSEAAVAPGESMPAAIALPEGFPRMVLFQWIIKGPKMDQVIRQATEAGVEAIVPVAGERCLASDADSVGEGKTGRWDRIVREARQQSGSPVPTNMLSPIPVAEIAETLAALSAGDPFGAIVLTEAPLARKSLHEYLCTQSGLMAIAVGPEGGMTAKELEVLASAGFESIHFRTNILRAETAALYGIAAVQTAITESEKWQLKE